MDTNTISISKYFYLKRIIISFIICVWGIYLIDHYNVDIKQTIIETVDGYEQIVGLITCSNDFLKTLEKTWLFENLSNFSKYEYSKLFLFMINSWFLQNLISFLYENYMFCNSEKMHLLILINCRKSYVEIVGFNCMFCVLNVPKENF